jgi:ubiquinone/menaquinone biosynthesis C-methylase UbiE
MLQKELGPQLPVDLALDVGCGTGHSTVALLPYARRIVGVDSSSEMLAQATRHERIEYRKGYAESIPVRSGDFDLVTVSSAYHWFDHELFLRQAARVLRSGGSLVLYKAGSTGTASGHPDFGRWRSEVLNVRYPKVARNDEPLTADRAAQFGFSEIARDTAEFRQIFTLDGYIDNLLTHSSLIRAIDGGLESPATAKAWLRAELAAFFPDGAAEFTHEARIHVLRREPKQS